MKSICLSSRAAWTDVVVYELWLPALAVRYLLGLRLREPFAYCCLFDGIHSFFAYHRITSLTLAAVEEHSDIFTRTNRDSEGRQEMHSSINLHDRKITCIFCEHSHHSESVVMVSSPGILILTILFS